MWFTILFLSRWSVKPPKSLGKLNTEASSRKVRWGSFTGQRSESSVFDVPIQPHIEGRKRSMNQCNPKGLPGGFARGDQPPTLPE
ncbi:hypothetical protein LSM04_004817 [Trypanosoma melophagium]|uniref:uncharacterized protein n=1 Tax=Trypanosoma melophagium TaxID=715481 RepID=UPI00351A8A2E|nr:hypothetical protein LSM04_004817 [Trypanosoma melophagium]